MHQYPSDISREEYKLIREDLEGAKKTTRPRKYDLYDVFCAVLYVIQGGIQWRMLPSDYPKWQSVYYHFRVWSEKDETGVSILDKVLQKLVKQIRNEELRRDKTTFGIVDAQSVQNADTAEEKGYDAGKKLSGIKRHVIVDTMGLPHAIAVTTADVTDRDGAIQMILLNLDNLSHVEKFLVDAGYSGQRFANQVKDICGAQVEVVKRSELHKFVVLPRRWVVERLFGWLDKFRRLWKNCERKLYISAQILTFALIAILIRRF
ncbi:IS5 family transposase, partial [Faecalibaculum rodentium]|uniref:IS5 family transposase n=1 Tax=Faecalibaculum rodentium TaxID=1702221 RepID=UPI0025A22BEB